MLKSLLHNTSITGLEKRLSSEKIALVVSTKLPAVMKILLSYGDLQSSYFFFQDAESQTLNQEIIIVHKHTDI